MTAFTVSALQVGSHPEGKARTLAHILSFEEQIITSQSKLVVMPEALLGGYPKGETFGTYLGYRIDEGRDTFAAYFDNAVTVPGKETVALAELSARAKAAIVIGVIERSGSTLYCTSLYFTPEKGLEEKHRKLMPTGTERLIWGQGDGSTLPVVESQAGRLGGAICWENHMPLLRAAMYAKGVDIWCAPTVDERDIWQSTMRHIGHEGRCFVVSACQIQPSPEALGIDVPHWDNQRRLIRGGSIIVDPMGNVLAGPLQDKEGLLSALIDLADIPKARYDLDVSGHYSRPDIFELKVDERPKSGVVFQK